MFTDAEFLLTCSRADEGEGRVSYPRPYSPANATAAGAADDDEGKIAYPQVDKMRNRCELQHLTPNCSTAVMTRHVDSSCKSQC
jgi:hypothetical protein